MSWIATAEECREMDRQAEAMGVTVEMLMHEAGRAVAACVLENYPEAKRIAVVCGKGNNGGDGLVAARLLAERQKQVSVFIAAATDELNENAASELERLAEVGIKPQFAGYKDLGKVDVVIDAVLGTGTRGIPEGEAASAIRAIRSSNAKVVAVDIPSGVECDTGAAEGERVRADHTVTFGLAKPFLFQGIGTELAGRWSVAPIGFPEKMLSTPRSACIFSNPRLPKRMKTAHKGSEGHVLVVAGSAAMPGAAVLCAYGALRAGAGLVTVASLQSVCDSAAVHIPESLLLPLEIHGSTLDLQAAKELGPHLGMYDSIVVGPGLSRSNDIGQFLGHLWSQDIPKPMVIDADALNAVSDGVGLPKKTPCVLTPHPGEAARLLEIDSAHVQSDRFASARQLSQKTGKTVLLKGAYSLIAQEGETLLVNPTGNPGMAAPGMGDVLSGVIGALLAKGLSPRDAAAAGAYWHGLAGDICAQEIGPAGFLASEVADALPRARATIISTCEEA